MCTCCFRLSSPQRQSVVDGVDGQTVLTRQGARRLHDDVGQVVDVAVGQRLALGTGQPQFGLGRRERVVDGVVSDARLVIHLLRAAHRNEKC